VKVPNNEEIADHIVPESCVAYREVRREAFDMGTHRPAIEPRNEHTPSADALCRAQGNTTVRDKRECTADSAWS